MCRVFQQNCRQSFEFSEIYIQNYELIYILNHNVYKQYLKAYFIYANDILYEVQINR